MRRTCFNCNNQDLCITVREVCKTMVFRLRKFDYTFLENTAKYCKSYTIDKPETKAKKQNQNGLLTLWEIDHGNGN